MTTPLSQMPKPEAGQYQEKRKLFLVPAFVLPPHAPEEGRKLLDRYWSEVRDHLDNLERSLGSVVHVYHANVFSDGEDGMKLLELLNPQGYSLIQVMCQSTARLEAIEDRALVEESSDWQRCISIGLASEKVLKLALEAHEEATKLRFEHMSARIDETLKDGEAGALFVQEDHRIQFPSDIQVFYVAPPGLDALKRWINDQVRAAQAPPAPEAPEETQAEEEEVPG